MIKIYSILTAGVCCAALSFQVEARTWTKADTGQTTEAEFVKVEGGRVFLKLNDGRIAAVEVNQLIPGDQEHLKQLLASGTVVSGATGGWPAFRGAKGDDISPDKGLRKEWTSRAPKQLWVFKDAGMGYSGYSIVNGKLYTMGTKSGRVHMVSVNIADGSEVWSTDVSVDDGQGYNASWGGGPRGTPSFSDGKLYGLDPKGVLVCVKAEDGSVLWKKDLVAEFGGQAGSWGFSESPLIDGNKVIVAPGGNKAGIVAFDKTSGAVIWEATDVKPGKAEYATIVPTEINGQRQYLKFFEKIIVSVDANTGAKLWEGSFPEGRTAVIPTPIVEGNQVYVSAGYGSGCRLFSIGRDNSVTELWSNKNMKNHHGGVIKFNDHLYGFSDATGLVCQDWKTGENAWAKKDRSINKGAVHIADGMIYALNEDDGVITLAEASPEAFNEKGRFTIEPQHPNRPAQGRIWTHPVVIDGKLYLRDQEYVYCYDVKN